MKPRPDDMLTPETIALVDQLAERPSGILHPERSWHWPLLQELQQARLLMIAPDKARGLKLVRIAWTGAGRAAIAQSKGVSS